MTPLHAYIAGAAIVVAGIWALVVAVCIASGRDDDRQGRPRG